MVVVGMAIEEDISLATTDIVRAFIDMALNDKRLWLRQGALLRLETIIHLASKSAIPEIMDAMAKIINDDASANFKATGGWDTKTISDEIHQAHAIAFRIIRAGLTKFPEISATPALRDGLAEYLKQREIFSAPSPQSREEKNEEAAKTLKAKTEEILAQKKVKQEVATRPSYTPLQQAHLSPRDNVNS